MDARNTQLNLKKVLTNLPYLSYYGVCVMRRVRILPISPHCRFLNQNYTQLNERTL